MKMKQIMLLVLAAGLLCSCGEREQAAAKVTYDKAVDALVEQVGKADEERTAPAPRELD